MGATAEDAAIRASARSTMKGRERANMAMFLGPAFLVVGFFFIVPVFVDIAISFTDLGRENSASRRSRRRTTSGRS